MVTAARKLKDACSLDKSYAKPRQCINKQRHHFADKGLFSQSFGFSSSLVWMWSWTIKKAECWRIYAFELWCWRSLLRVPWTARRSNQSILKEMNPEYSSKRLILKLKHQYFYHLMQWVDSLEKTLMFEKIEDRNKEKGTTEDEMVGWHHQLNGHEFEQSLGVSDGQWSLKCCSPWGRK